MRILGFSKKWDKLKQDTFTTFRFPRRDRDWEIGEQVRIVYKPRSKDREILGVAKIINKELRKIATAYEQYKPTEIEAQADGFDNLFQMNAWFRDTYGSRIFEEPMNKLTLMSLNTDK